MVQIKEATVQDAAAIAQLYLASFPESIEFFFAEHNTARLRALVAYGFELALMSACLSLACRNNEGHLLGYCLVSSRDGLPVHRLLSPQQLGRTAALCFKALSQFKAKELLILAQNQLKFGRSTSGDNIRRRLPGGRIISIAVHPGARGQGLGKSLLARSLDFLEQLGIQATYLEVRPDNLPAKRMYESFGFSPYGQTEDLQGPWLRMVRVNSPRACQP